MKDLEVYLVRHGKTVFNTLGRLQGWSDSPLTEEGRAAAADFGAKLARRGIAFDAAFSSTAPRATATARLLLEHAGQAALPLAELADLRECCFGGFEGEHAQTLYRLLAERNGFTDADAFQTAFRWADRFMLLDAVAQADPLHLAENHERFTARTAAALKQIALAAQNCRRVLAVAHGMTITAVLKSIDPAATEYRSVPNLSLSRLRFSDGLWRIESVGEVL